MKKQNSIKHNIASFFVGVSALLTTLIVVVAVIMFIPEIRQVEEGAMEKDLHQAAGMLALEFKRLDTFGEDWAYWDDTYSFLVGESPGYERSNLNAETLRIADFGFINLTTLDGEIVSGRYLKPENSDIAYSGAPTIDGVWSEQFKTALSASPNGLSGYLSTHLGTLLFVARPVLTSHRNGPSRGWFIIGRWLNSTFTKEFSSQRRQSVLISSNDLGEGEHFENEVHTNINFNIKRLSFTEIRAKALFLDYKGDRAFTLTINEQRIGFIESLKALVSAISGFIFVGILCTWFAYRRVKKVVLVPLSELAKSMELLGNHNMQHPLPHTNKSDEINLLYSKYQEMALKLISTQQKLKEHSNYLEEAAVTDPLTKVHNRRHLERLMMQDSSNDLVDAKQKKQFLIIDVDNFKQLNDTHGHAAGDKVLIQLAKILRSIVREEDHVVRMGGEEFLIVATCHSEEHSQALAERIRTRVENFQFDVDQNKPLPVTVSVGFAFFPLCQSSYHEDNWERSLGLADYCLYQAKEEGRNTWVGIYAEPSFIASQLSMIPVDIEELVESKALRQVTLTDQQRKKT